MTSKWERVLLVAPPAITVVVVALGLRMGASQETRAALVYGTPPAKDRDGVAWTVNLVREERGVREPIANEPVCLSAMMSSGRGAYRHGTTNADGVLDAWLALEEVKPGDPVEVSVRSECPNVGLRWEVGFARGKGIVPPAYPVRVDPREPAFLNASRRAGAIALDVMVLGRSLAAEFPSRVLVRATDATSGAPLGGVRITVDPEPGLEAGVRGSDRDRTIRTCDNGWGMISMTARAHVVGATLRADMAGDAEARATAEARAAGARTGEWFGALPVTGGALFVAVPDDLRAWQPTKLYVRSPSPRDVAYVEIYDGHGRVGAESLHLTPDETGMRGAEFEFRRLPASEGFIVTSSDPRGASALSGTTMAFPFVTMEKPTSHDAVHRAALEPCAMWPKLARMTPPAGYPRTLILDGFASVHASAARERQRGLGLAVVTVLLAALVETLLLLRHARRARAEVEHVRKALEEAIRQGPYRAAPHAAGVTLLEGRAGTVALGVGIALLGFALLAALLLQSSS